MITLEILPVADDIDHTDGPDCICGPTVTEATVIRHHALATEARETPTKRDWQDRWVPLINLVFVIGFAWLAGAIWHPSHTILRWALIAVSTAYLAWTITSWIHTRRNK